MSRYFSDRVPERADPVLGEMLHKAMDSTKFAEYFASKGGGFKVLLAHKKFFFTMTRSEYIDASMEIGATAAQCEQILANREYSLIKIVRYYRAFTQKLPPDSPKALKDWGDFMHGFTLEPSPDVDEDLGLDDDEDLGL